MMSRDPIRDFVKQEPGASAYAFARGGVIGALLWMYRGSVREFAEKRMTWRVALIGLALLLAALSWTQRHDHANEQSILRDHRYSYYPTHAYGWSFDGKHHRGTQGFYVSHADYQTHRFFVAAMYVEVAGMIALTLLALAGGTRRARREASDLEYGADTPAARQAATQADQTDDAAYTRDDWLVDPPWSREEATAKRPVFGRSRQSYQ